ncbi:polyprenyl diphosphate synthase [Propionibacterium australiense]|uniref:Isoprenyl transferase n=1 Tax=Propionibacterium australiense TaxID=119981 RepID=A0A383S8B4_9ACTN|nr:polyprenyl diphosphate synthase [Propionibacterium australiense]RLP09560.1 di-trans,poly-cis-decaprenylcistransferase [Propionibacterium australiense]RLP09863.1 di-trans,poly-cis-decaprenylcistransferase [Propionibacterium australiense]SYZ34208.1 Undecaprenyl pyrophosphate synthase family signature [Propionibacterium australiense]VEH89474.1 Short-chain Z-isoprenyl diphosphate synthase [Propionibacterium australiense]
MVHLNMVNRAIDRLSPEGLIYTAYQNRLRDGLAPNSLPRHVAVLADGNRRWARLNAPGRPLEVGYQAGADKLRDFVGWCDEIGVGTVTLWVLSTENLQRSADDELAPLMEVITKLTDDLAADLRHRVMTVGDLALLPGSIAERLRAAERASAGHTGTQVNMAVAYGGRHELRDAFRSLLAAEAERGTTLGELANTLEVDQISEHLYTRGQPDPDLLIRTSGEQRLSGFLPWQSAHSELYFCEALWPDFRKIDFFRALRSYQQRERRFGK